VLVVDATQCPPPSQVAIEITLFPAHVAGAQVVPVAYEVQAPAPLQRPLCPQLAGGSTVQMPRGSTSPAPTGWHVPARPVTLHAWQLEQASTSQQAPSVQ
jgi:hypothetical protein